MEYKSENKTCQNCKTDFTIEPDDFGFYEKMQVPAPEECGLCRQQARLIFRNFTTLYKRKCDKSGREIIAVYGPNTKFPVYGLPEWWGDGWDPLGYGQDIDWGRPFFAQFGELLEKIPHVSVMNKKSENCEYSNQVADSKSCYQVFGCTANEYCDYGHIVWHSKYCVDNLYIYKCESCYECVDCVNCNMLLYSEECESCAESIGLYDCKGCINCIGCVGLVNKSYCIFNKQVSKEEYAQFLQANPITDPNTIEKIRAGMEELRKSLPQRSFFGFRNHNSSGNHLYNTRNVHSSFDVKGGENSKFCFTARNVVDTYDAGFTLDLSECYQVLTGFGNRMIGCHNVFDSHDVHYSDYCYGSSFLFGCSGLRNKSYCILNKQYSKEEYSQIVPKMIEHMKKYGEWGKFFPKELSPFGYNEAIVNEYIPLTKEEALAQGYKWQDNIPSTTGQGTVKLADLPKDPKEYTDALMQEVLTCERCDKNFRLISREIAFYKRLGLPLPRKCVHCRHERRMKLRNPRLLWDIRCAKCQAPIQTSYTPDKQKVYKIYCEKCYQQEVY